MKFALIYLHILILSGIHTPVFADITDSTRIGINVVIKEVVPCQFQFSTEGGIGSRVFSYIDSFDCTTDSNSDELYDRANNLAHKSLKETHEYPNQVRIEETVE